MDEMFGKFVKLIHPFDYYDMCLKHPGNAKEVGTTGIPIHTSDGRCYLSSSPVVELDGTTYVVTTTVEPSLSASIK